MSFLKTRNRITIRSNIPLLGIHPDKTINERDTCAPSVPMFVAALFAALLQPKCPLTDEWTQKLWYIYTMQCYSALKKRMHLRQS